MSVRTTMQPGRTATAVETVTSSNRRAQPVRRARTKPARVSSTLTQSTTAHDALTTPADRPIPIFPALTHFADTMTALPRELVRHFTLLKEVDAKIFAPEEALFQLITAALNAPIPDALQNRAINDAASVAGSTSAPMSIQDGTAGSVARGATQTTTGGAPSTAEGSIASTANNALLDPANIARRQLFRQCAFKMSEMLGSLEEKNHVISTANDALSKHLLRIDDVWPYLEDEFSDEAKWGSETHWAYPENRAARNAAHNTHVERTRREGAASLSAAAQALADEAAARSDARKQAVAAKKTQRMTAMQQANGSDVEESNGKRTHKRKTVAPNESPLQVGLGLTTLGPVDFNPAKRRKVGKSANGGGAEPRSAMAEVMNAVDDKLKRSSSPKPSPALDNGKKVRKALPSGAGAVSQPKKRNLPGGASPAVSSPIVGSFGDLPKVGRSSPPPTSAPARPSSSRVRQNSFQRSEGHNRRPSTAMPSNAQPDDLSGNNNINGRSNSGPSPHDMTNATEPDVNMMDVDTVLPPLKTQHSNSKPVSRRASMNTKRESVVPDLSTVATTTFVTTKSGRTSKPSTPSLGSAAFPDLPTTQQRPSSRPSRNHSEASVSKHDHSNGSGAGSSASSTHQGPTSAPSAAAAPPKRSHKKGASAAAAAAAQRAVTADGEPLSASTANGNGASAKNGNGNGSKKQDALIKTGANSDDDVAGADEDVDENEPTYCYCNGVSYGDMIGCDGPNCEKEWFHLECVGLRVAPKENVKWYCDKCKEQLPRRR